MAWRARLARFSTSDLFWFDALSRDDRIEVMAVLTMGDDS